MSDMPSVNPADLGAFLRATGFVVEEQSGTVVSGYVELGTDHLTPWGVVHGGVYATIVESAGSIGASAAVLDRGQFAVGLHNSTDFLRAVSTGTMTARSKPIHRGRRQQLWEVDITDQSGKLIAQGRVRLQNIAAEN